MKDEIVQVTIDCKLDKVIELDNGTYLISWFDGKFKVVQCPMFTFVVQDMATALNNVTILLALNPSIYKVDIKKI